MLYLLAPCVLVAAVLLSMFGQGGGVLYTPLQVWFGIAFHEAATTSLFLIMVTSISATLVYRKEQRIDWPLVIVLESTTTLGGLGSGLLSASISETALSILFSATLILTGCLMTRTSWRENERRLDSRGTFVWRRRLGDESYGVNLAIALPLCFVVGSLSGLLGIGVLMAVTNWW